MAEAGEVTIKEAQEQIREVGYNFIRPMKSFLSKADVEPNGLEYEDEFAGKYVSSGVAGASSGIIEPPFLPKLLQGLVQQSNAVQACIEAVVTNVHGTGYVVESKDPNLEGEAKITPEAKKVLEFFDEVWPKTTFNQLRKQIGEDVEIFGMAYVEIVRNMRGQLVMLRRLDPKPMRMVKLGEPITVNISIWRGGEEIKVNTAMRYRRYVQQLGSKFIYFKEYGCPLPINKKNGEFKEPNERVKMMTKKELGSEILAFTKMPDVDTPYCVPAWITQTPSVLGSRKAEEFNLDYFNAGGVPPFMVFVHGGIMATQAKIDLQHYLASKPGAKQGVPVFETYASGGSLDSSGSVRVTVERFGNERQKDSMFENYDAKCEERIRRAWRLPPLFVGSAKDYTFATAYASYTMAEAQVFAPMRREFDATINSTIIRELDPTGSVAFRSLPTSVNDVTNQLTALELAVNARAITPTELVEAINTSTSLHLTVRPGADQEFEERGAAEIEGLKNPAPANSATANQVKPGSKKPTPVKTPAAA